MSFLQKLQNLPLHHRKRLWIASSVILTGIIFMVWFSTMNSDFLNPNSGVEYSNGASNEASPTATIGSAFGSFWGDVKTDLGDLKSNFGF